jgi:hypothetical protein
MNQKLVLHVQKMGPLWNDLDFGKCQNYGCMQIFNASIKWANTFSSETWSVIVAMVSSLKRTHWSVATYIEVWALQYHEPGGRDYDLLCNQNQVLFLMIMDTMLLDMEALWIASYCSNCGVMNAALEIYIFSCVIICKLWIQTQVSALVCNVKNEATTLTHSCLLDRSVNFVLAFWPASFIVGRGIRV